VAYEQHAQRSYSSFCLTLLCRQVHRSRRVGGGKISWATTWTGRVRKADSTCLTDPVAGRRGLVFVVLFCFAHFEWGGAEVPNLVQGFGSADWSAPGPRGNAAKTLGRGPTRRASLRSGCCVLLRTDRTGQDQWTCRSPPPPPPSPPSFLLFHHHHPTSVTSVQSSLRCFHSPFVSRFLLQSLFNQVTLLHIRFSIQVTDTKQTRRFSLVILPQSYIHTHTSIQSSAFNTARSSIQTHTEVFLTCRFSS